MIPVPDLIYYLHPLLAGRPDNWRVHFERCARMGFRKVLLAPPFAPGRSEDIFLTADHNRLHPKLGGGDALDVLSAAAIQARSFGLELMLDLVLDRVATDSRLAGSAALYRTASNLGSPPDPRRPPVDRNAAVLQPHPAVEVLLDQWLPRLKTWQQAGIAGFRCDAPHHVAPSVWRRLISEARSRNGASSFIAWVPGTQMQQTQALNGCGFDLVSSSSWAWDFKSDWLDEETRRLVGIGRILAMPELPFGARVAHQGEAASRRAIGFAAAFGQACLMPMGVEFGATAPLSATHGDASGFDALMRQPYFDLQSAIGDANRLNAAHAVARAGKLVSSPFTDIAAIERSSASECYLILVNSRLDNEVPLDLAPLLPAIGAAIEAFPESNEPLHAAEVRLLPLELPDPVRIPGPDVSQAVQAPRLAIEAVSPSVDNGRFAVKQRVGQPVVVAADMICEGHDKLAAVLMWRTADEVRWHETPLVPLGNDRWTASFTPLRTGRHLFTVAAWLDIFGNFRDELGKKYAAGLDLSLELREGIELVSQTVEHSANVELAALAKRLDAAEGEERRRLLLSEDTARLMAAHDPRAFEITYAPELPLDAERTGAGFASWYEMFPRSQSAVPGQHGTFTDVIAKLPAVRDMGFDVLYFPPIHPIGSKNRKGPNNTLVTAPGDPGSPYAIGSDDGGHDAIHSELGTLQDFRALVAAASEHGMEIALDFAIQCSPDHPWLREHPDWFTWRPDGSIHYAENPPKKYEDIVNVAFYAEGARPSLWIALRDIVQFWVGEGVKIFRVDNPHTKPLPFWEWMIADIRGRDPDVIFLAEAFTKPKMMYRLAKVGFSQSYTYFTWRNTAREMREYLTELSTTAPRNFFRPNLFVNTPDIHPIFLHDSGRPGFLLRAALAATLSGLWGVYSGFEVCEARSLNGREEYLDSEKYQLRKWDLDAPGNIVDEIRRLNNIRRTNPALHSHLGIHFLLSGNENLLCYAKTSPTGDNIILVVVSFDPRQPQEADFDLTPEIFGYTAPGSLVMEDLFRGGTATWQTGMHRLRVDPATLPFGIWRLRQDISA